MIPGRLILAMACALLFSGCMSGFCRKPGSPKAPLLGGVWAETKCKVKNVASAAKSKCGFRNKLPRQACEPKPYFSIGYSYKKDIKVVKKNAKMCAHKSMRSLGGRFSRDFKDGFETAYTDISLGASGATPPIPPEKYWKAHFRTLRGHARAQQWFEGYRAGAQHAEATGFTRFNEIPSSRESVALGRGYSGGLQPAGYVEPQNFSPEMFGAPGAPGSAMPIPTRAQPMFGPPAQPMFGPAAQPMFGEPGAPGGAMPIPAGAQPMFGPPAQPMFGPPSATGTAPFGNGVQIPQFSPQTGPTIW